MGRNGRASRKHHSKLADERSDEIKKNLEKRGMFISWMDATEIQAIESTLGRKLFIDEVPGVIKSRREGKGLREILKILG
jgi:hypothetical protein